MLSTSPCSHAEAHFLISGPSVLLWEHLWLSPESAFLPEVPCQTLNQAFQVQYLMPVLLTAFCWVIWLPLCDSYIYVFFALSFNLPVPLHVLEHWGLSSGAAFFQWTFRREWREMCSPHLTPFKLLSLPNSPYMYLSEQAQESAYALSSLASPQSSDTVEHDVLVSQSWGQQGGNADPDAPFLFSPECNLQEICVNKSFGLAFLILYFVCESFHILTKTYSKLGFCNLEV